MGRRSWFGVRGSWFGVRGSALVVRAAPVSRAERQRFLRELVDLRDADDLRDRVDALRLRDPPVAFRVRRLAEPLVFVCPACRRCLLTVAAAISLARLVLRPRFFAEALMCSYWRARFALFTPRGGIRSSSNEDPKVSNSSRSKIQTGRRAQLSAVYRRLARRSSRIRWHV